MEPVSRKRPLEASLKVESWMYQEGPRDGDILQLQWMRMENEPKIPSSLNLRYAVPPLELDPNDFLPAPIFVDPEAVMRSLPSRLERSDPPPLRVSPDELRAALDDNSTQKIISLTASLGPECWDSLLGLAALGADNLARLISATAVEISVATALGAALLEPLRDTALHKALRQVPDPYGVSSRRQVRALCHALMQLPCPRSAGARACSLGSLSLGEFSQTVTDLGLRLCGEPGLDLEASLCDAAFQLHP